MIVKTPSNQTPSFRRIFTVLLLAVLPILLEAHQHVRVRLLEEEGDGGDDGEDGGGAGGIALLGIVLVIVFVVLLCVCVIGAVSWFCCCGEGCCGGICEQASEAVDM